MKAYQYIFFLLAITSISKLHGQIPVSLQEAVKIGGIYQWVSMKGTDERNPVLLFLHGGPGNSAMRYASKFTGALQEHFVVVMWDQRESGKTLELNPTREPMTLALMESDALEMINHLRTRFSRDKIYLMGHSWGGFLGLRMAFSNPQLLHAYFAVSPMVNQLESERLSLEWMKERANRRGDQEAVHELSLVRVPFQTGEQLYYHRRWLAEGMGTKPPARGFVVAWAAKWLPLYNEASSVNLCTQATEVRCPIYFFVGIKDHQTNFKLTEQYFHLVKAEKKELFWFSKSAHNLNLTEPGKLQELVILLSQEK